MTPGRTSTSRSSATARSARRSRCRSAARGTAWRVFERYGAPYPLPRAVHIDHEIMRLLQAGRRRELPSRMVPLTEYRWFGARRRSAADAAPVAPGGAPGWDPDYLFYQPDLEATLERAVESEPTVTGARGCTAEGLQQADQFARRPRAAPRGEARGRARSPRDGGGRRWRQLVRARELWDRLARPRLR